MIVFTFIYYFCIVIYTEVMALTTQTASEPAAAYGTNSYVDVMNFLHSMPISRNVKRQVAIRLVKEVSEPALADAFDKLDELSRLPEDWDGEGALPISYSP